MERGRKTVEFLVFCVICVLIIKRTQKMISRFEDLRISRLRRTEGETWRRGDLEKGRP